MKKTGDKETTKPKVFEYAVGEKTYVMRPMVLAQAKQLSILLKDRFPGGDDTLNGPLDFSDILEKVQDVLPEALAIVLVEKGSDVALKDRTEDDLKTLADVFTEEMSLSVLTEVVSDFLEHTPIISVLQMLRGLLISTGVMVPVHLTKTEETESKTNSTGSIESSSTSQEGTSSKET